MDKYIINHQILSIEEVFDSHRTKKKNKHKELRDLLDLPIERIKAKHSKDSVLDITSLYDSKYFLIPEPQIKRWKRHNHDTREDDHEHNDVDDFQNDDVFSPNAFDLDTSHDYVGTQFLKTKHIVKRTQRKMKVSVLKSYIIDKFIQPFITDESISEVRLSTVIKQTRKDLGESAQQADASLFFIVFLHIATEKQMKIWKEGVDCLFKR